MLGDLTYPLICRYVDEIVTVSEQEIAAATLMAMQETHLMLEPSGVLGLAAVVKYERSLSAEKPIVVIASGGNTTLEMLYQLQEQIK